MCGKPRWPNTVCCAESTDSSGTRRGNSDSSKWRLLAQTSSRLYVNLEFRLLLTEDYYIAIHSHGALSQVATDTNLLVLELQRPSTNDNLSVKRR